MPGAEERRAAGGAVWAVQGGQGAGAYRSEGVVKAEGWQDVETAALALLAAAGLQEGQVRCLAWLARAPCVAVPPAWPTQAASAAARLHPPPAPSPRTASAREAVCCWPAPPQSPRTPALVAHSCTGWPSFPRAHSSRAARPARRAPAVLPGPGPLLLPPGSTRQRTRHGGATGALLGAAGGRKNDQALGAAFRLPMTQRVAQHGVAFLMNSACNFRGTCEEAHETAVCQAGQMASLLPTHRVEGTGGWLPAST